MVRERRAGGGHCHSRSHSTNTPSFLGINYTFGIMCLEEKSASLKIFFLSRLILGLEQPSW